MARKKNNKRNDFMEAINEMDDMKTTRRNELLDLKFPIRAKFKNKKQQSLFGSSLFLLVSSLEQNVIPKSFFFFVSHV